jgi:MerR-like DNA binding protein
MITSLVARYKHTKVVITNIASRVRACRGLGRRVYREWDLEWLEVCVKLRASGMPLTAIRRYAAWSGSGVRRPSVHPVGPRQGGWGLGGWGLGAAELVLRRISVAGGLWRQRAGVVASEDRILCWFARW